MNTDGAEWALFVVDSDEQTACEVEKALASSDTLAACTVQQCNGLPLEPPVRLHTAGRHYPGSCDARTRCGEGGAHTPGR
eukprot:3610018-Pyramimonas_sp.AAC.1